MRKRAIYTILLIIISFISFTNFVSAEEYSSGIMPKSQALNAVDIGKIHIESFGFVKHFTSYDKKGDWIEITTHFRSDYATDTSITYKLSLFNPNQELLKTYEDQVNVRSKTGGSYSKRIMTWEDGFDVDNVYFYMVEISVPLEAQVFDGADKGAYFLENFKTEINVNENNVYNIRQTFEGKFKGASRAINLYIPYRHIYWRSDETKVSRRAIISDLEVSDVYDEYIDKGKRVVVVGQSDPTVLEKSYDFRYTYNVGEDNIEGNDELLLYLLKDLEVEVNGLKFSVTMPKEFNKDNIAFVDEHGNKLEDVVYEVNENVITGEFKSVINKGDSCAIRVLLPEGYFVDASSNVSDKTVRAFIIPVVFVVLSIVLCLINRRRKNIKKEKIGLYLGEDIDSLELGYVLKGAVKETDISSLIFCLANKKYIEIDMNEENYTITKNKDYAGNNKMEEILMKRLFKNDSMVTRKNLKENLNGVREEIDKYLKYKKTKRVYIYPLLNYKLIFWVMIFFIYYTVMDNLLFEYQPTDLLLTTCVGFVGFVILLAVLLSKKYQIIEKILCALAGITIVAAPIILTSYEAFNQDILYVQAYVIGVISIISIAILSSLMSDRTMYGNRLYRKILAYKNYLSSVSPVILAEEMEKNDKYFYEVLPYVLVMGMSDKFIEKFTELNVQEPIWYETSNFDLNEFYEQIKNIYSDFYVALKNK